MWNIVKTNNIRTVVLNYVVQHDIVQYVIALNYIEQHKIQPYLMVLNYVEQCD